MNQQLKLSNPLHRQECRRRCRILKGRSDFLGRDYQKCGYNESYTLAPAAYSEASDRVYLMLPEGASVYADDAGCPVIDYDGFKQGDVINQYDGNGCRPYIIDNDRRRAYLEVVER